MQVQDVRGAGAFVQVVHVLGDHADAVPLLQARKGLMCSIGLYALQLGPALVVEIQDEFGVADKGFGRGHVLDAVLEPQAIRTAKGGDATLGADARASQNHDMPSFHVCSMPLPTV